MLGFVTIFIKKYKCINVVSTDNLILILLNNDSVPISFLCGNDI